MGGETNLGFASRTRQSWADRVLGKSSQPPDSQHSAIREMVIEYIYLSVGITRKFLMLACLLVILNPFRGWHVAIVSIFFGIVFQIVNGYRSRNHAATLWAYFSDRPDDVEPNEFNLIRSRFSTYSTKDDVLTFVGLALSLSILIMLIIKQGWTRGLIFFIVIQILLAIITRVLHNSSVVAFKKRIQEDRWILEQEYIYNWKNDHIYNPKYTFVLTIGNIIFTFYLIFLCIIKLTAPENPYFIIYFYLTVLGTGILILSGKNFRNRSLPEFYRRPLSTRFSYQLSRHIANSIVLDELFAIASIICVLSSLTKSLWLIIAAGAVFTFVGRFGLTNGALLLFKRFLDRNFNIVIFRRFRKESMIEAKNLVYPVFGAYGQLFSINDEHLEQARSGSIRSDSQAVLNEHRKFIYSTNENWQFNVRNYLLLADLVVFYWAQLPSTNMVWEFEASIDAFPANRLIILCPEMLRGQMKSFLSNEYPDIMVSDIHFITINPETKYKYLSKTVNKIMRSLQVQKRPGA